MFGCRKRGEKKKDTVMKDKTIDEPRQLVYFHIFVQVIL